MVVGFNIYVMKINGYNEFINEEFFKKFFKSSKKTLNTKINRVDSCFENILNFLAENDVYSWDDFINMSLFDRNIIDKLIDSEVNDMNELSQVKFKLKLELMNRSQLIELKNELEAEEEYEKCALILKKINKK